MPMPALGQLAWPHPRRPVTPGPRIGREPRTQILPFSTGVIMEELPVERIMAGLPAAIANSPGRPLGCRPPKAS